MGGRTDHVRSDAKEKAMGIDDLAGKAGGLGGDKGEQISDAAIDKGEDAASQKTGGKYDDKVATAGDAADQRIGGQ